MTHDSGLPLDEQLKALQYYIDWTDIVIFGIVVVLLSVGIWKLRQRRKKNKIQKLKDEKKES